MIALSANTTRKVPLSPKEIRTLLELADRDLHQARLLDLHPDTRYALAYNAGLQLATAALRLHGVRIRKARFHARTFAELKPRLPEEMRSFADYFDRARRKRHTVTYDRAGAVSEGEVDDLIEQVCGFREWLHSVLKERFPGESSNR